jgi:hypothetical protein
VASISVVLMYRCWQQATWNRRGEDEAPTMRPSCPGLLHLHVISREPSRIAWGKDDRQCVLRVWSQWLGRFDEARWNHRSGEWNHREKREKRTRGEERVDALGPCSPFMRRPPRRPIANTGNGLGSV